MKLSSEDLTSLRDIALRAAQEAGRYIQSQFDKHNDRHYKQGGDTPASQVVTSVDATAQKIILKHLEDSIQEYDLGLLTEEQADDRSRLIKDFFWCIDPMDGTLAFIEKRSGYAVSVALVNHAGDPIIGVVYVPDSEETYTSMQGSGVQLNSVDFKRPKLIDESIHVFMDRSMPTQPYFDQVTSQLADYAIKQNKAPIEFHSNFGAVRNAMEVLNSGTGCYFKFPKRNKGGGSIWDFAATRLFFEELDVSVSNASCESLHLNNPDNTFMNEVGVVYATNKELSKWIIQLNKRVSI
ncbi:inositol monophosphatase family protein [Ekhidna sp.]|uniref:3'(2'),5'-bisphosphate nucleotidase CysQ family protein n=1 Tax=Ekhidna sp. TaxID=2608089 RepID=UPI0032968DB0